MKPPIPVIGAIILNSHGELLLAQRPEGKHLAGMWEFPGGKVEAGESAVAALERELQEELHLQVKCERDLGVFYYAYPQISIDLQVMVVRAVNKPQITVYVPAIRWLKPNTVSIEALAPADRLPLAHFLTVSRPSPV